MTFDKIDKSKINFKLKPMTIVGLVVIGLIGIYGLTSLIVGEVYQKDLNSNIIYQSEKNKLYVIESVRNILMVHNKESFEELKNDTFIDEELKKTLISSKIEKAEKPSVSVLDCQYDLNNVDINVFYIKAVRKQGTKSQNYAIVVKVHNNKLYDIIITN